MISPFHLHRPTSIEQACSLLSEYGDQAKILAGGSELILLLKMNLARAEHIVDIKAVEGLDRLEFDSKTEMLRVGGLVTHRNLEQSALVRDHCPLFAEMEQQVANVRVRNVGTIGGNLCFAEPHADPGTLLSACDGRIKARSIRQERSLDIADFFVDYYQTALEHDEILTEIEIPKLSRNSSGTYLRFCPGERPSVAVAILIEWADGACANVRLALGCVGPKPIRAREVEMALRGKPADEISAKSFEIGERAALVCDPPPDIWGSAEYKRQIVKTLVGRGFKKLCARDS